MKKKKQKKNKNRKLSGQHRDGYHNARIQTSVLAWYCLFPLPLGVWEGLRFVIVGLPGLFSYRFWHAAKDHRTLTKTIRTRSAALERSVVDTTEDVNRFFKFSSKIQLTECDLKPL